MDILRKRHTTAHTEVALSWHPALHERIMVIAPHPDDEALAAGGVISMALKLQNKIRVIVATNGDASYATALAHGSHLITRKNFKRQAIMRQNESLNALAALGLDAEHVRFWGFPDRGLASLWKSHQGGSNLYHSPTTGHTTSVQALNSPILPYTGASLNDLFQKELLEFRPTVLIMPHPQDNHSDHSALAGFTLLAVKHYYARTQLSTPVLLAYWMWAESKPWMTGARPHNINRILIDNAPEIANERYFTLAPEILEQKRAALQCYPSQKLAAGPLFKKLAQNAHENFALLQIVS